MTGYICILTDDVFASIGIAPECANCGDASWWYRHEQPILNDHGVKFCTVECADEWDTRVEREEKLRDLNCCKACGFDNWEHDAGCPVCPAGWLTYGPPKPRDCPTCHSPAPHLHPAVQFEGEVQPCYDPFHEQVTAQNTPERIAEHLALKARITGP